MIPLPLPTKVVQKQKHQAVFEVQGLYPGYGVTIGNALRRVLLSSMEGAAVTEVKIKGAAHEFSTLPGVMEDVIMILLNLKNLRFKIHEGVEQRATLKVKGAKEVTGADFELSPQIELSNPELHVATITDKGTELEIEIKIEKGVGYEPKERRHAKKSEIGSIAMDAIFTPIKNVNFQVESMRVGERTDFDKLSVQVETDGTITPEEAFYNACDLLIQHFNIVFEGKSSSTPKEASQEQTGEGEDVLKTLVEDLKLSTRTINALTENSIKTVGGLIKKSEKTLSELEGVGESALEEIRKALKKLGLELKAE